MYNNIQRYDKERGVYYEQIKKEIHGDACERSKADNQIQRQFNLQNVKLSAANAKGSRNTEKI